VTAEDDLEEAAQAAYEERLRPIKEWSKKWFDLESRQRKLNTERKALRADGRRIMREMIDEAAQQQLAEVSD
jgi:hypothetical protein